MPQFLKHYMIRKYGLKSIALKNLANLAAGVRQESRHSDRLRVFGKITGMVDPHDFRENESNLVLVALRHLYQINEIHFKMDGHPRVALSSVCAATLAGVPLSQCCPASLIPSRMRLECCTMRLASAVTGA